MNSHIQRHLQISIALCMLAGAVVLGVFVAHYNQRSVEEYIVTKIHEQETYLLTLAEITDGNGADEAISTIITDCPRRNEYEGLLINLSTLSKRDLITVQNLFESCGGFYAERKALMVAKLERELSAYMDLLDTLTLLNEHARQRYDENLWNEIISLEKERSTLLTDQNILQGKIINALISGSSPQSKEVGLLIEDARQINELLTVNGQRVDTLRRGVTP